MENHRAYHDSVQPHNETTNRANDWNEDSEQDISAAYAYTSLPFMVRSFPLKNVAITSFIQN